MEITALEEHEYVPLLYQAEEICDKICLNVEKTQKNIITLHGDSSDSHMLQDYIPFKELEGRKEIKEFYLAPGKEIVIQSTRESLHMLSFICNGLSSNTVKIPQKINHIILRECKNLTLELLGGTISGIDILKSSYVNVKTALHNYTNIEYVSCSDVYGSLDAESKIYIRNSMDIRFENVALSTDLFSSALFTREGRQMIPKDGCSSTIMFFN